LFESVTVMVPVVLPKVSVDLLVRILAEGSVKEDAATNATFYGLMAHAFISHELVDGDRIYYLTSKGETVAKSVQAELERVEAYGQRNDSKEERSA